MTTGFRIAKGLTLPIEAVTETFAILAKRGKGKTHTGVVMTEEMVTAGHCVIVLDPVGVWWGIRASADGKGDGLPVVIFGGDHADVPLREDHGALIADVLVEQRISAVLDLSILSKAAARRFAAAFLERLYHRNREAMHVMVDEADMFAPQRAQHEGLRLLGAMEDLVRRGRARGIGVTLITQRPAVLHKDVLTQAEVLIALGMTGPRDVAAIDEWVRLHADEDEAKTVKASLPSLDVGEAWVWSPGWLGALQRVKVRARRTFDSSATPKPGQARPTPKRMADVDLDALGAQIEATIEQAKAEDPAHLRTRIRTLEKKVLDTQRELLEARDVVPEPEVIERPVLDGDTRDVLVKSLAVCENITATIADVLGSTALPTPRPTPAPPRPRPAGPIPRPVPTPQPVTGEADTSLPKAARLILTALVQYGPMRQNRVALITGYRISGNFRNALSTLRTNGYIEGDASLLTPTLSGQVALGSWDPLPVGRDLLEHWKANHLSAAAKAIVDVLADAYPAPVSIAELAAATGYQVSGNFRNACSQLRTAGIASGKGHLVLDPTFAEAS